MTQNNRTGPEVEIAAHVDQVGRIVRCISGLLCDCFILPKRADQLTDAIRHDNRVVVQEQDRSACIRRPASRPILFPRTKPRFRPWRSEWTCGNSSAITAQEPSSDPLSTTTICRFG